ncbi:hypothetical protein HYZ41_03895, partial [archaeon]|nr:hypothetical protein [archaeon]
MNISMRTVLMAALVVVFLGFFSNVASAAVPCSYYDNQAACETGNPCCLWNDQAIECTAKTSQCRASAGTCDVAESCDGTNPYCPTDAGQGTSYTCSYGSWGGSNGVCTATRTNTYCSASDRSTCTGTTWQEQQTSGAGLCSGTCSSWCGADGTCNKADAGTQAIGCNNTMYSCGGANSLTIYSAACGMGAGGSGSGSCDSQYTIVTTCGGSDTCTDTGTSNGGGSCSATKYYCSAGYGTCQSSSSSGTDTCTATGNPSAVTYYYCSGGNTCLSSSTSRSDGCSDTGSSDGGGTCGADDWSCTSGSLSDGYTSGTDTCGGTVDNPSVTYYSCSGGNACVVNGTTYRSDFCIKSETCLAKDYFCGFTPGQMMSYATLGLDECGGVGSPNACQKTLYHCTASDGSVNDTCALSGTTNIASGNVCTGSGTETAGSSTYYCGLSGYNGCGGGLCQKKQDYLACSGSNTCTVDVGDNFANVAAYKVCSGGSEVDGTSVACDSSYDYYASANACTYETRYAECNGAGSCDTSAATYYQTGGNTNVPNLNVAITQNGGASTPYTTPSASYYCGTATSCTDGTCTGTTYYRACAGTGSCRTDNTGAGSANNIYASAGYTLTGACGTTGTTLCGYSGYNKCSNQTPGRDQYRCDASQNCASDVGDSYDGTPCSENCDSYCSSGTCANSSPNTDPYNICSSGYTCSGEAIINSDVCGTGTSCGYSTGTTCGNNCDSKCVTGQGTCYDTANGADPYSICTDGVCTTGNCGSGTACEYTAADVNDGCTGAYTCGGETINTNTCNGAGSCADRTTGTTCGNNCDSKCVTGQGTCYDTA